MTHRPMSAEHSSRLRLLQAYRDGDPYAFTLFDKACRPELVQRISSKFSQSKINGDCEDVVQVAILKLFSSSATFASDAALLRWLETCAYRSALNILRRPRPEANSPLIDAMREELHERRLIL